MSDAVTLASFGTAFGAGVLSVLSPCVLPLMPAYLSLVSGLSLEELRHGSADRELRARVLRGCLAFCAGFSSVFVVLGASATVLGRLLRSWRLELLGFEIGAAQVAGAVIVAMGLHLAGLLPIPALYRERRYSGGIEVRNVLGAYLVGAAFAFGWSPCVGPILGGILTLAGARETLSQGVLLLTVYSGGLAVPFLAAGWSVERFLEHFRRIRPHLRRIEVAAGLLLVAIGLLVTTDQLARLNGYFLFLDRVVHAAEQLLL
jgi:cytochrome c-type biogenesis protein